MANRETNFQSIYKATIGVIFLGCIHEERDGEFSDICLRCAAVELNEVDKKKSHVLEMLEKLSNWDSVKAIHEGFRDLDISFPIRSFYETVETIWHARRLRFNSKSGVVGQSYHDATRYLG